VWSNSIGTIQEDQVLQLQRCVPLQYNVSAESMKGLQAPVLVIHGRQAQRHQHCWTERGDFWRGGGVQLGKKQGAAVEGQC